MVIVNAGEGDGPQKVSSLMHSPYIASSIITVGDRILVLMVWPWRAFFYVPVSLMYDCRSWKSCD